MRRAALIFGLVFSTAVMGIAQARIVTNFELDKFKEQRLAAERDYRENYARLGFPSPEELDRRRDADMTARIRLSDQLRQARLEKERIELERRNIDLEAAALANEMAERADAAIYGGYGGGYGGFFGGFGGFSSDGRFDRRRRGFHRNGGFPFLGGYRATPVAVYPIRGPHHTKFFSTGRHRGGGGRAIIRTGRR